MEVGTAMSVVQTLLAALQCSELKELCSIAGYKSQLEELQDTVNMIQAVLEDAEQKQVLSKAEQLHIEKLKDVVDEADNLFDEFVTVAETKKLSQDKVRLLSVFSEYGLAYKMSHKAKKIKAKLDKVAYNKQFSFKHNPVPIRKISRETCSYEHEEIIGREDDLKAVMDMLLEPNVERDVSFLSVVGIGGLGKTALAQKVFNDPRVKSAFSLTLWTCVSDEDHKELNVKDILCKILGTTEGVPTLDEVQMELRAKLQENMYFLVLDDVWTENRDQWSKLIGYLMGGQRGSWILVTTRSLKTARLLENGRVHKLSGLSEENSLRLLKKKAFGSEESSPPEDLLKIGQVIVERCAYVPLAIRVVGSLLYGQDKRQWQLFQEFGLANVNEDDDGIKPILKISYDHLPSPLKSCISYCSLYPKDQRINKEHLIQLWMAQGYLATSGPKTMEEVGEEYVLILIDRGFFQNVRIRTGQIITSFKIHDLIHDVMGEVVGKEIRRVNSINGDEGNKVRHISLHYCENKKHFCFSNKTRVRSFLLVGDMKFKVQMDQACMDALVANWEYLRTLDLSWLGVRSLPRSIGNLLHLRYLDLSHNKYLELLPRQITRLSNLVVLKLFSCTSLKELPKDMSRLIKLRVLDNGLCSMTHMPKGIGELKCLHTLASFVVGEGSSKLLDAMEDLKGLSNLKDFLRITFKKGVEFGKDNGREGGYLLNKEKLDAVEFCFEGEVIERRGLEWLMDELQPHHNLKKLFMNNYQGTRMPGWARVAFLPNLVVLLLFHCSELKNLGCLRNMCDLQCLYLEDLPSLEYINEKGITGGSGNTTKIFGVLPSSSQPWEEDNDDLTCLPKLKMLEINNCPSLLASLQCPLLEYLRLERFNKGLQILNKGKGKEASISPLTRLAIHNVQWLKLVSVGINRDKEVECFGDFFHICSSSLQELEIERCENLTSVFIRSENITNLKILQITSCPNLKLSLEIEEGSDMPWPSFAPLHSLKLSSLPQLVNLPDWIQHLTALRDLEIEDCTQLESLPNWMSKLPSLRYLRIDSCSETLKERCREPIGQDWPLIAHIPHKTIG